MPTEVEYYTEISDYLRTSILDNIVEFGSFIVDFIPCSRIDLRIGINEFMRRNSIQDSNLREFAELCRGLKIDILGIIYSVDKKQGIVIICEIKMGSLSLNDYSQLIGYCIASDTPYGLLIGIDGQKSHDFKLALIQKPALIEITRTNDISHNFGICCWNSHTKKLIFDNDGAFESTSQLIREFVYNFY